MRYVEGSDLRTLVRAEQRLEPARAAHIVAQVASALDAAHARGIVHRDVKPANVLLGANDHAYLTDFGLTKRVTSHTGSTRDGGWVGTLGYVAPEQIRGERLDARADVYALGCVLYHSLSGVAALPARERRGDAVGAPQRRPALAARPRARASRRASTPSSRARWPRTPTTASPRPATSAARRWPPRAGRWRRRPSAWSPSARRRPATRQETVVSPDQAPTVLAASRPPRAGCGRGRWPRCRSPGWR